jgi:Flp pilus assembly protein TadD
MKKNLLTIPLLLISICTLLAQETNYYDSALTQFKSGNFSESIKILQPNVQNNTTNYREFLLLAHSHWALGNTNQSIDNLYSALKLKPNDTEVYIEIIKAHIASSRFKGALELVETAEQKFPNSKELKLQKAFIFGKYGKINTALAIIETIKQESPNDPRPLAVEAELYFLQGDLEKAEMSLKWAISLQENSPFFHNNLALIYDRMSDNEIKQGKKEKSKITLQEAEKSVDKAISIKEFSQMLALKKRIQEKLANL